MIVKLIHLIGMVQASSPSTTEGAQVSREILTGVSPLLPIPGGLSNLLNFGISLGGLAALGVIIVGGILYSVSGGNQTKQTEAIGQIKAAALGMLILLGGYLLLNFLNPSLLS